MLKGCTMTGSKVVLTYKRKRQISTEPISLETRQPEATADPSILNVSVSEEKLEESTEGNKSESPRKDPEDAPERKRLCSDDIKQLDCSSAARESIRGKEKNNSMNEARQFISGSHAVPEGRPGEGGCEKALGDEFSSNLQNDGKSICIPEGPCPYTNSYSACASTEKGMVPPSANLDTVSEPHLLNLKSSTGGNYSHERMVSNASEKLCSEESGLSGLPSEDEPGNLYMNATVKSRFTSPVKTFHRRSKQKKDEDAGETDNTSHSGGNCSSGVEGNKSAGSFPAFEAPSSQRPTDASGNPKRPQDHLKRGHSFKPCQEKIAMQDVDILCGDTSSTSGIGSGKQEDKKRRDALKDSRSILEEGEKSQSLPNNGLNSTRKINEMILNNRSTIASLDLSVPPPVDCNIALEPGHDEQLICSSLGSTIGSPAKLLHEVSQRDKGLELLDEKIPKRHSFHQAQKLENGCSSEEAVGGKYNNNVKFSPVLPMRNNCLQLFPEDRTDDTRRSWQNMTVHADSDERSINLLESRTEARATVPKSSLFLGLSLPMEPTIDSHPCNSTVVQWPNVGVQSRGFIQEAVPQYFPDQSSSFLRHKMMLDNIVSRARTHQGNRSSYIDRYDSPTTWSEEELDCLWIGVRRYGRGNWCTMLRDPRLHFLPWRTPRDLAEQWEAEQSKLFNSSPFPHIRHFRRPNIFPDLMDGCWHPKTGKQNLAEDVHLSLGDVYCQPKDSFRNRRSLFDVIDTQNIVPRQLQKPVTNTRTKHFLKGMPRRAMFEKHAVIDVESSFSANPKACMTTEGNLPHWLREVAVHPRPPDTVLPSVAPALGHGETQFVSQPCLDPKGSHHDSRNRVSNNHTITQRTKLKPGTHHRDLPSATGNENKANKQDLIIINSDASSEETISDDHGGRP